MNGSFWYIFILFGSLQGLFLTAILLFNRKGLKSANRVLALLIFSVSADMFMTYLYLSDNISRFPHLISTAEPLFMLYGPLLYIYTKMITTPRFIFKKHYILFFLPSVLEAVLWIPFYLQPGDIKLHELRTFETDTIQVLEFWVIWNLELAYNIIFAFLATQVLKNHTGTLKNLFSDNSYLRFARLRNIILFTMALLLSQAFIIILTLFGFEDVESGFTILYCSVTVLFYSIGYIGLRQFHAGEPAAEPAQMSETEIPQKKYAKSSLDHETSGIYLEKLLEHMESDRLYLTSDLKLKDIAEMSGISTNHASQIINEKLGKNFFDFVNTYRVQEAQKMLADDQFSHLTLLAIAFDAGFSSKSSFNKIFKDHTGMTPSEYRRKNLISSGGRS